MREANARVVYNSQVATSALKHYTSKHAELTEPEVETLRLIDSALGAEAARRKAGNATVPAPDLDDDLPMTMRTWDWVLENLLNPLHLAFNYRIGQSATRIDALERRIAELEKRPAGLRYREIWSEGTDYTQGDCVTWRGSMWIARRSTSIKPGDVPGDWVLAVKAGRDAAR